MQLTVREIVADLEAIGMIQRMIENDEPLEKRADDIYSLLAGYSELLKDIKVRV